MSDHTRRLALAAVIVAVDVVLRAAFSVTIGGSDELSGYALAIASAFASRTESRCCSKR